MYMYVCIYIYMRTYDRNNMALHNAGSSLPQDSSCPAQCPSSTTTSRNRCHAQRTSAECCQPREPNTAQLRSIP